MATLKNTTISSANFLQLPSGTAAQRPGGPSAGMMRYNTSIGALEIYKNGTWEANGWPYLYYDEGINASSFTANWSITTTTSMTQFGGFGPANGHGWVSGPSTYTLTLTGIPAHNTVRYRVYWHFVDSADNETNHIDLMNSSGTDTRFLTFRKTSPTGAVAFDSIASGVTANWISGQSYSYKPWGDSSVDGYVTFDSGYYAHTSSTYTAKHIIGLDQGVADEAVYLTHVQLWLGA